MTTEPTEVLESSSVRKVFYSKDRHKFILLLDNELAIVYDTTNLSHPVRIYEENEEGYPTEIKDQ